MKNDSVNNSDKAPVVIPDECGDSMWDEVLNQEVKACQVTKAINGETIPANADKNEPSGKEGKQAK